MQVEHGMTRGAGRARPDDIRRGPPRIGRAIAWAVLASTLLLSEARLRGGEPLTRQDLVKRGKAATALLVVPSGSGTAFCVSADGLWVTNEHVVRAAAADGKVQL